MITEAQIRQLIQTSTSLSEAERTEWLDLLPFMNDKQQSELLLILQPDIFTPDRGVMAQPVTAPPLGGAPVPTSPPASATTVSAFLNKNFAAELHRGSMPGTFKPEAVAQSMDAFKTQQFPQSAPKTFEPVPVLTKPADVIPPVAPPATPVSPASPLSSFGVVREQKPVVSPPPVMPPKMQKPNDLPVTAVLKTAADSPPEQQEPVINIHSLEAVRMLNVATLRGKGVMNMEAELKQLCEKFGYFSVQFAFEQSPLYQAYIAVGARILKDHQTFEEVQAALAAAGRPYLAKPEFEEFSDLLRRLRGHA